MEESRQKSGAKGWIVTSIVFLLIGFAGIGVMTYAGYSQQTTVQEHKDSFHNLDVQTPSHSVILNPQTRYTLRWSAVKVDVSGQSDVEFSDLADALDIEKIEEMMRKLEVTVRTQDGSLIEAQPTNPAAGMPIAGKKISDEGGALMPSTFDFQTNAETQYTISSTYDGDLPEKAGYITIAPTKALSSINGMVAMMGIAFLGGGFFGFLGLIFLVVGLVKYSKFKSSMLEYHNQMG